MLLRWEAGGGEKESPAGEEREAPGITATYIRS